MCLPLRRPGRRAENLIAPLGRDFWYLRLNNEFRAVLAIGIIA
jgi:hypothetical protein